MSDQADASNLDMLFERALSVLHTFPEGTRITKHPSGDGWIAAHPEHPAKWVHLNGVVEVITPMKETARA